MADSVTGEWPGASRDGEPELIRGQLPGSVQLPNKYNIRTTPVPAGACRRDWIGFFNSKLSQSSVSGYHDGNAINVEYDPGDESKVIEMVDAAIEYANERLKALPR
jgi:hypothetical protein